MEWEPQKSEMVSLRDVRAGDCIKDGSHWRTVSKNDIQNDWSGLRVFGDSYNLGQKKVTRALFPMWNKSTIVSWHPQV